MNNRSASDTFAHKPFYRKKSLTYILSKIQECNQLMAADCKCQKTYVENNENEIRDKLHYDYLNNRKIRNRIGLSEYIFQPESPADEKKDGKRGRTDLKVMIKSQTFNDPAKNYFTLECKRIDGSNKLNKEYVSNGMLRFIDKKKPLYRSCYNCNAMLGFIVKSMDIDKNIDDINKYILENLTSKDRINAPRRDVCYYTSSHVSVGKNLELYHLMLDIVDVIK